MGLAHWNYFLAIEQSVEELSRYVEFHNDNMRSYSIEIAYLLMSSTYEIDVLLKQICNYHGITQAMNKAIETFFPIRYPNMLNIKVEIPRYDLTFEPFIEWKDNLAPTWWTANNKVKHERHTHYNEASLNNMLLAVCGLYLSNIYYYLEVCLILNYHDKNIT